MVHVLITYASARESKGTIWCPSTCAFPRSASVSNWFRRQPTVTKAIRIPALSLRIQPDADHDPFELDEVHHVLAVVLQEQSQGLLISRALVPRPELQGVPAVHPAGAAGDTEALFHPLEAALQSDAPALAEQVQGPETGSEVEAGLPLQDGQVEPIPVVGAECIHPVQRFPHGDIGDLPAHQVTEPAILAIDPDDRHLAAGTGLDVQIGLHRSGGKSLKQCNRRRTQMNANDSKA